jgi:acyl dehydratase
MGKLDALQEYIGQDLGAGDWFEVTQDSINKFADATGDHQWIHVDEERAAQGPFGGTIAHGFLTLSLIVTLPGGKPLPIPPGVKMGINYGLDRVRFIAPVRSGSRIRARRKLLEAKEGEGFGQTKTEVTVELEGSDKPACVAETISRFYF